MPSVFPLPPWSPQWRLQLAPCGAGRAACLLADNAPAFCPATCSRPLQSWMKKRFEGMHEGIDNMFKEVPGGWRCRERGPLKGVALGDAPVGEQAAAAPRVCTASAAQLNS